MHEHTSKLVGVLERAHIERIESLEASLEARAKGEREMTEDERREAEYLALEEAFMIEMGLREAPTAKEE